MTISIIKKLEAPVRKDKASNEERRYYLAGDIEVILTVMPPDHTQPKHGHSVATEVHYVQKGKVEVQTESGVQEFQAGDVFAFSPDRQLHQLRNPSKKEECLLLTIKVISDGRDHTAEFKGDKVEPDPQKGDNWVAEKKRLIFGQSKLDTGDQR